MPIETRPFGPDNLPLSRLGFGCGGVGGLMVRGAAADQEAAVARALEAGINYFDTAVQYGNGASEQNLGTVLRKLRAKDALVGTKVRLRPEAFGNIAAAIAASLDGSLKRLQREQVDIFYLHNEITLRGGGENLSVPQVLEEVVPAFQALQAAGKLRLPAMTAVGETAALQQVIEAGFFGGAQVIYNMLNPSAGMVLPNNYPAQDYRRLLERMRAARMGAVGIRVLAGGALSGSAHRHPVASPPPAPMGSGTSYDSDLRRASRLTPLVEEGFAASLPEAAIRFATAHPAMGTVLVGMASLEEFEAALAAVLKGPLPAAALQRVAELTAGFSDEDS
ncbi:aldo/keto reductase [Roseomonas sp. M0104]|uniref:Aldo/keto reductase n=1 Tax=Teichococcus coralli TaxID=2545983 RepID=A0A845BCI7_9PROT|nr:aldo/keto reductase [Pseudoroseomonas coralli]MXP63794.1 aldo/keto reductase [Pseudoroseomonas coralli]